MTVLNVPFNVKEYKDKETGLWLIYSNKYAVSAYGRTKNQARLVFQIQIRDIVMSTKPKPPKRKIIKSLKSKQS